MAAKHRADHTDELFRVARLRDPSVDTEPQSPYSLRDRRMTGTDDDRECGQALTEPLYTGPEVLADDRDVEHERVETMHDERLGIDGGREDGFHRDSWQPLDQRL